MDQGTAQSSLDCGTFTTVVFSILQLKFPLTFEYNEFFSAEKLISICQSIIHHDSKYFDVIFQQNRIIRLRL